MYYTYQNKTYRHAAVFVGNKEIELTARTTPTGVRILIIFLFIFSLGLAWLFWWSLFRGSQIISHHIPLSDNLEIKQIDERTVSVTSGNKDNFILFSLESEDVKKLMSPKIFKPKSLIIIKSESETLVSDNNEKSIYIKVATRADIPENADADPKTGAKIVYIVEDED